MDVMTIASASITLLTPYLAKLGDEVVKRAAGVAWEKMGEIYNAIKDRISKEKDEFPKETLKRYEKEPEKRKLAMQETLADILAKDPKFAQKLSEMVEDANKAGARAVFTTNVYGGEVGEIINIENLHDGLNINKKK